MMTFDVGFFPTGEVELWLSHLNLFSKVPLGSEIYSSLAKIATHLWSEIKSTIFIFLALNPSSPVFNPRVNCSWLRGVLAFLRFSENREVQVWKLFVLNNKSGRIQGYTPVTITVTNIQCVFLSRGKRMSKGEGSWASFIILADENLWINHGSNQRCYILGAKPTGELIFFTGKLYRPLKHPNMANRYVLGS